MLVRTKSENLYCDRVIWDAFKSGNKEAFAMLYYRYFRILFQNCFKVSNDKNLIEDCIHDLFLEIWMNKMNLVTPVSVKGYLLCSIQRKIIRQIKKDRNWQNRTFAIQEKEKSHSIEEKIISDQDSLESSTAINNALNTLTKRQKEAVRFRYFDNLSYSEISIKMEISTDSVYNLVSKALEGIHKRLQKKDTFQNSCLN